MEVIIILIFLIIMFCYYENNVFDITKFKISANVNNKVKIIRD